MIGEVAIFGVYLPTLLVLGLAALLVTGLIARLLALFGAYRWFRNRPLVDLALFVIILGLLSWATGAKAMP